MRPAKLLAYLAAQWAQLHSRLRDPDVEDMSSIEIWVGIFLGMIVCWVLLCSLLLLFLGVIDLVF